MRILTLLLLFPAYAFAQLSATPVQSAKANTGSAVSNPLTATLGATPKQYNTLMAVAATSTTVSYSISQTGVSWREIEPTTQNATGPSVAHFFFGWVWSASASTTVSLSTITAAGFAGGLVVAEFAGANLKFDANGTAIGNNTAPAASVTPNSAPSLVIGCLATRGTWSGATTVFSAPTNSFTIVDQANSTINTTNNDRAVAMLAKFVTDTSAQSAGATIPTNAWVVSTANFNEVQAGFIIQ